MIIPGLTDVDLSALANMSIEELEDLETMANERAAEFQMQLEAIQHAGGVSKEQANQFKGILPPQIAMESFTAQVTHTNYAVATESLSTAAKVAIGVGLAAALGGLVFLLMQSSKKGDSTPNTAGAEKLKKLITVKDDMGKILGEFKVDDNEHGAKVARDTEKVIREMAASKSLGDAAIERLKAAGLNNYTLFSISKMRAGNELSPWPMAENIYTPQAAEMEKEYTQLLVPAVDAIVSGKDDSATISTFVHLAAKVNTNTMKQDRMIEEISRFSSRTKGGAMMTHSDPLHQMQLFIDWAKEVHQPSADDVSMVEGIVKFSDKGLKVVPPNLTKIVDDADKAVKLAKKIEQQQERMKGLKDVGTRYTGIIDTYVKQTKRRAKSFNMLLDMVDLEIQSFNKLVALFGSVMVEDMKSKIEEIETMSRDDKYDEGVRTQLKSLASRMRKQMSEVK